MSRLSYNMHHTQFYRAQWESMPQLARIRRDSRLIVPMELEPHAELHREVPMVSPLSINLAQRAFSLFNDYGDVHNPIDNLQNYMASIDEAARSPKASETEKAIADLAVWQCELQIPFIEDGWVDLSKYGTRVA